MEALPMKKPTKRQVEIAKVEICEEDRRARRVHSVKSEQVIAENHRRSSLPSEDPEHVHGMLCDGQDGMNSYCERLREKLFRK